jgi:hypothetical protein
LYLGFFCLPLFLERSLGRAAQCLRLGRFGSSPQSAAQNSTDQCAHRNSFDNAFETEHTFGILKQHAYKGYSSIEYDAPGNPYKPTADLIEKTVRFLS